MESGGKVVPRWGFPGGSWFKMQKIRQSNFVCWGSGLHGG